MKKFFKVVMAALAACAVSLCAVSCGNSEVDVKFVAKDGSGVVEDGVFSGRFYSDKLPAGGGNTARFYIELSGELEEGTTGVWEFGMVDPEAAEITPDTTLVGFFKGDFVVRDNTAVLNREYRISGGNWVESAKPEWKSLKFVSQDPLTFAFTLSGDDMAELK